LDDALRLEEQVAGSRTYSWSSGNISDLDGSVLGPVERMFVLAQSGKRRKPESRYDFATGMPASS